MNPLWVLADQQHYDHAGGSVGGLIFVVIIIWLLLSAGNGPKKK